ncbi:NACHT, LRR and PYD domains-containing protein 12-like [Corythoichthys intestinalis]|uniref:NACHT, LRR and PYD domains-containing protein 12-like n=1 Tax=Corythoichthys intestinalis TaxID=161448 RepID=UPI0025A53F71|nr:NACHT, LRR and PYD domains-containing protein 12-like [Corythoichthys intestinalis]XP_057677462.1 NACHT, LRR and PYD domains-containing protein 12-like [Corythoichthys intestinalis]XP_057677539.1 NACHT, LRR and PYD domains-containing protein 12-like [Corythoichthys intestinalis]XP_057677619.1 NACHT, LRR and PYD domains-containing protein 12-like [Corythoichthys intestinalis]XP_057677702.1 NACHT, LRR and PYD domains-containing protein 12-like [Corythoichthys intestinalis]XP_057677781.1 NACHT
MKRSHPFGAVTATEEKRKRDNGAVFSIHDDEQIDRLKADLQKKLHSLYSFVPEGNTERWQQQPLANVYTELVITCGADIRPDERHEVLQMETRAAAAKKSILPCDIFKSHDGQPRPIRTLLTVGFAGIGKTFLVQKLVCDWASGNANQDVHFIFPFTFRELNTDEGKNFTLAKLIRCYVCESRHMSEETLNIILDELQKSGIRDYESSPIKILFVLDGLDECKFKMDLKNETKVDIDVTEAYPLEILLAHLIKRNLLPCARVWITTRPATARDIPSDLIDGRTEVRGFSDSRRLEYFRKKFPNEERVIKHIRKTRTILIMCHLPIFCWLTATVLQDHLDKGKEEELPATLTDMYSEHVFNQLDKSKERQTTESADYVKPLAKLAFDHTMSKQQIFYEEDLAKSGFDYSQAAKHSGIFTEVFEEVRPLRRNQQGKMFQFVHLSIQEYLAAFHVMICLFHDNKNILADSEQALECVFQEEEEKSEETESEDGEKESEETGSDDGEKESEEDTEDEGGWKINEVHRSALQKASESEGNLDLFIRFLFGLSLACNQKLVGELLKAPQDCRRSKSKTVKLIKERIKQNTPEKNINLFYCLKELKDDSLLKEFQIKRNSSHRIDWNNMPNDMWSALAFYLLTDDENMKSFKLRKYAPSPLGLEKLLVVVKASEKSNLRKCGLDKGSCHLLASVLSSPSNMKHLDLCQNDLSDEGVEILSKELASPNCTLEELTLRECGLDKGSCHLLASVLSSPSNMKHLDLSQNDLSDEGVEILSKELASPNCKLESLDLWNCKLGKGSCHPLASVLSSPSNLKSLSLSLNNLSDEGVEILSKGLASPHCTLESLRLMECGLSKSSCHLLTSVPSSPSNLKSLDLSYNNLSDKRVEILSKGLASPNCTLEKLSLWNCNLDKGSCDLLASVLSSPSNLKRLDLRGNNLSDEGVEILSKGLASPNCTLEKLILMECDLDKGSCHLLASVLSSPSNMKHLDLYDNGLSDEGVEILSKGLASPNCTLESLDLSYCDLGKASCHPLASVLSSPSNLRDLDLSLNNLSAEGVEILSKGLASPNCTLEKLTLHGCDLKKGSCHPLASVLSSPSNLKHLNLTCNNVSDEGVKILSKGLASPHCKFESLALSWCHITNEGCVFLAEALKLNPSHLEELDLRNNPIGEKGKRVLSNVQEDPSYRLQTVRFDSTFNSESESEEEESPEEHDSEEI